MNKSFSIFIATIIAMLAGLVWLIGPGHEYLSKRNTHYSVSYTDEKYAKIEVDMNFDDVIRILGEPVDSSINHNYPVWALSNSDVRQRLGKDNTFNMKVLKYSQPIDSMKDYELIHIAFCPSLLVINKEKWVTD